MLDVKKLHLLLDAMAVAVTALLALAASTVLYSPKAQSETETEHLQQQMRSLLFILYTGAVFLVLAILRLSAILHWSVAYLQPMADHKVALFLFENLNAVTTGIVTTMGSLYTLVLAAIYLPAAIILNLQSKKKDVTLPISVHLLHLAAILGPLLAGPVGELLSRLK
jgi:hypothetical protein